MSLDIEFFFLEADFADNPEMESDLQAATAHF